MTRTLITNASVVDARGESEDRWILVDNDTIAATGPLTGEGRAPDADTVVDLGGAVVTPGLIDLHVHGAGGHSFDDGPAAIAEALAVHRAHGTTRSLISLVANPVPTLAKSLQAIGTVMAADPLVLGAHLEGPFLSPDNRGAHSPHYLATPDPSLVDSLLDSADGLLRAITIAPELPGALEAIDTLVSAGVKVALGHTVATYDQTIAGFDRGASMLTHAFNAMPGVHHRAPGPVIAAVDSAEVTLELILDGVHVHPRVARALFDLAPGRVALITDAMAAAGAADGAYRLGSLDVTVDDGVARLTGTTTIAGSTLTLDRAIRLAVSDAGLSPVDAVAAATLTPATALGVDSRFGLVETGFAADLVVWSAGWQVERVWAAGLGL